MILAVSITEYVPKPSLFLLLKFSFSAGRSNHPSLQDGAAIHIKLSSFQVDYYPYHLAVKDRSHWGLYRSSRYPHPKWLAESQDEFRNMLLSLVQDDFSTSQCSSPISKTSMTQVQMTYLCDKIWGKCVQF